MIHRKCRRWIGERKRRGLKPMMTARMLQYLGRETLKAWAIRDTEETLDRVFHPERVKKPNPVARYIEKHRAAAGLRIDAERKIDAWEEDFAEYCARNRYSPTSGSPPRAAKRSQKGVSGRRRTGASLD